MFLSRLSVYRYNSHQLLAVTGWNSIFLCPRGGKPETPRTVLVCSVTSSAGTGSVVCGARVRDDCRI